MKSTPRKPYVQSDVYVSLANQQTKLVRVLTQPEIMLKKIDKSFVLNIETNRDSSVIVRSIIDLGHNLGLKVVAEGVESAETLELLRTLQCDEAQGYYLSRPITAEMMTKFLMEPLVVNANRQVDASNIWQPVGQPSLRN